MTIFKAVNEGKIKGMWINCTSRPAAQSLPNCNLQNKEMAARQIVALKTPPLVCSSRRVDPLHDPGSTHLCLCLPAGTGRAGAHDPGLFSHPGLGRGDSPAGAGDEPGNQKILLPLLLPFGGDPDLFGSRRRVVHELCTTCDRCDRSCPLRLSPANGMAESLYCWNCGECVDACPSQALSFQWRQSPQSVQDRTLNPRIKQPVTPDEH